MCTGKSAAGETVVRVRLTLPMFDFSDKFLYRIALNAVLLASFMGAVASCALAERLPVKTYTIDDGLPRDLVTKIIQDSRGFLWFGTPDGLSRFDGYTFTNYGTDQGLPDRQVVDIIEARDGIYWIATDNGLCRFTPAYNMAPLKATGSGPSIFTTYYPSEDRRARSINALCEDASGAIWCGTDRGLFRVNVLGASVTFSPVDIEESKPSVRAMIRDRGGSLWIVDSIGLHRIGPDGVIDRYGQDEGLLPQYLRTLMQDREDRIWVGSSEGLYELVDNPKPHHSVVARIYKKKDGLATDFVTSVLQSADGRMWVTTSLGLTSFTVDPSGEAAGFRSYDLTTGLTDISLTSLCEDRDRNLWVGTETGVMRIAANGLATYGEQDGLQGIRTSSIFQDHAGRLCVINGNWQGKAFYWLNVLSGSREHPRFEAVRITPPKGVSWGWYQVSFQDSTGGWWMMSKGGLVRYSNTVESQIPRASPKAIYTTKDGLAYDTIFRLFEDSSHDIWIGTIDGPPHCGLTRWDRATETFHTFASSDGIPEAVPTAFCEDGFGNLWIGFYDGTLARYRDGQFRIFPTFEGVMPGLIRGMYLDSTKRLWVATGHLGVLCIMNPGAPEPVFTNYSKAEGLSSEQATCVTEDRWGMIYIGTGHGVDKLDPATGRVQHITKAEGLPNSFINVSFRDADGSLWFGTLQGLCRLAPVPDRPFVPPPIWITSLAFGGVGYPLPELGTTTLAGPEVKANQNNVQIEFSGLSLTYANSLRYQYELEGASSEWSAPFTERTVRYPNLPPGYYTFSVRAIGPNGAISDTPAKVSFRILPAIWQRWWFRAITVVVFAIPVILIARYRHLRKKVKMEAEAALRRSREERLAELERVRTRIATDLHDDIGSSLSQIYLLSEVARQRLNEESVEAAEPLAMISNASHEVVSSMSDIVWAINPKKDHLSDLVHRMRRFASDVFAARCIDFRFIAPDSESDARLGADLRREIFLIFKESVNNIVRHSGCSQARIEFQMSGQSITLAVSDNGMGFDPGKCQDGHGLVSLRERAKSIGGDLELIAAQGAGTTIRLHVRVL
jgi:ligand-binding sensor domain-containing protein/signal transduction histidine kinase